MNAFRRAFLSIFNPSKLYAEKQAESTKKFKEELSFRREVRNLGGRTVRNPTPVRQASTPSRQVEDTSDSLATDLLLIHALTSQTYSAPAPVESTPSWSGSGGDSGGAGASGSWESSSSSSDSYSSSYSSSDSSSSYDSSSSSSDSGSW